MYIAPPDLLGALEEPYF